MEKKDLQSIEKYDVNFFVTGDKYVHDSLNLKFFPRGNAYKRGGIILADADQNLAQSCSIAKHVFEHVESGKVKFVLIGLSPYVVTEKTKEPLVAWDVKKNIQILEEYLRLCLDNGAKPVVVALPVSSTAKKNYKADVLKLFRDTINKVGKKYNNFAFIDLLDTPLDDAYFQDKAHLKSWGVATVSTLLSSQLYLKNVISMEDVFFDVTYNRLVTLSNMLPKDDYNDLVARIFRSSIQMIGKKDKIKVGFVIRNVAEWCGDDLYNLFVRDKRFEPTIFLVMRENNFNQELYRKDFYKGAKQFKQHNLPVVIVDDLNQNVPVQDLIFFLTPYLEDIPHALRLNSLTTKTLLMHLSYSLSVMLHHSAQLNKPVYRIAWKEFASSSTALEELQKECIVGLPRGFLSGYPRMDIFFKRGAKFNFSWKKTRSDARKIIWTPHWSVAESNGISTFRYNHQFMYEFVKSHPEISFVVKPHPNLFVTAIKEKIFESETALEEYFQRWNELPNAQVCTGAYYQEIFATSNGLINDSGSFIAEYQYVNKPMIFLTRKKSWRFNSLGESVLQASYCVDGTDLDGIAKMIQEVFIEGKDYKAAERREVFDKYLNYPKYTGMLASEFMYKSIVDELKEKAK